MALIKLIGGPSVEIDTNNKTPIEVIKEFEQKTGEQILHEGEPIYHIVMIDGVQLAVFGKNKKMKDIKEIVLIPLIHGG